MDYYLKLIVIWLVFGFIIQSINACFSKAFYPDMDEIVFQMIFFVLLVVIWPITALFLWMKLISHNPNDPRKP